ncbi:hypothetical protein PpBr36_04305 [Pyricularia pennisetigena]|uniref:hypothetical protein n=1 Tax=Pyricularia pennisetigena TaxID=1578925 RepID=UPI00114F04F8|nr:hypothetical protein PpBr36_04305 [Pyricularia pennisetigena]TLS26211.1 hypothetical protein PpBr36_04305 [Pyricularia pennisetigena]
MCVLGDPCNMMLLQLQSGSPEAGQARLCEVTSDAFSWPKSLHSPPSRVLHPIESRNSTICLAFPLPLFVSIHTHTYTHTHTHTHTNARARTLTLITHPFSHQGQSRQGRHLNELICRGCSNQSIILGCETKTTQIVVQNRPWPSRPCPSSNVNQTPNARACLSYRRLTWSNIPPRTFFSCMVGGHASPLFLRQKSQAQAPSINSHA